MRSPIFNRWTSSGMAGLDFKRAGALGLTLAVALLLSGRASTNVQVANAGSEQLGAVQSGNVSTTALPPIGPNGEVQGPTALPPANGTTQVATTGTPNTGLPPVGAPNSTGREHSSRQTDKKQQDRWTGVSGAEQCAV